VTSDLRGADGEREPARAPTILLLDDDTNTLVTLHCLLERTRAQVVECEDEPCALRHCQEVTATIDLLVADVILQHSNGPAVVRKVKPLQPLMRLLYISGFSLAELHRRGLLSNADMSPGSVEFLQKPFSPEQFLDSVSRLLVN
jgi:two-component system cell cycle sensor histidine kinase/response regulator CckA